MALAQSLISRCNDLEAKAESRSKMTNTGSLVDKVSLWGEMLLKAVWKVTGFAKLKAVVFLERAKLFHVS